MLAELPEKLKEKLEALPPHPGVYVFRDAAGAVLYVGKAKSLRSRVRSYFLAGSSDQRAFLPVLVQSAADLETIRTETEKEAAILENSLIKEMRPKFNVKLRDDKEFLSLRLDSREAWPRLTLVRTPERDGAQYFGPYHSATSARRTLQLVERHFQLRNCSDHEFASRKRPCLQYQIKRCSAPCVLEVPKESYAGQVRAVGLFLDGRHDALTRWLGERMKYSSGALEYEQAANFRDQLRALDNLRSRQRVVAVTDRDQDVLGLYRQGDLVELALVSVREGRVVEASSISHTRAEVDDAEVVATFLREQYGNDAGFYIPDEVIVPVLPDGDRGVADWLSEQRRKRPSADADSTPAARVALLAPERGDRYQLLQLAMDQAKHAFEEKRRQVEDTEERLLRLQARLRLTKLPRRIECSDISHLGGQDTYGSVVLLVNGVPDRRGYRSYKITRAAPGDDYAAQHEVMSRRFLRGKQANAGEAWQLPDLFVVDGGRGQLAAAMAAAQDLGLTDLQLAGLAKERDGSDGERLVDRVYLPGQKNPVPLKPNSPELFLLAHARDEAHRFANRSRERAGTRRRLASELDPINGLGPKTKVRLLRHFGTLDNVKSASDEELLALPGVNRGHVRALRQGLTPERRELEELEAAQSQNDNQGDAADPKLPT